MGWVGKPACMCACMDDGYGMYDWSALSVAGPPGAAFEEARAGTIQLILGREATAVVFELIIEGVLLVERGMAVPEMRRSTRVGDGCLERAACSFKGQGPSLSVHVCSQCWDSSGSNKIKKMGGLRESNP